jgi:hypothetical protein
VLLPQSHKPLEPLHILPVEMLSERSARRWQRRDRFGIGAKLAAKEAVCRSFPRFMLVNRQVAAGAAHFFFEPPGIRILQLRNRRSVPTAAQQN